MGGRGGNSPRPLATIVLAAGRGVRMHSELPKVLHPLGGRPMLEYVLELAAGCRPERLLVVVGHGAGRVREACRRWFAAGSKGARPEFVLQRRQLGTGHAVKLACGRLRGFGGDLLILSGDVPLLKVGTLRALIGRRRSSGASLALLTAEPSSPKGYGRIIRDERGRVLRVVEEADALPRERRIREINTGTYCFESSFLMSHLKAIRPDNRQRELYLTDLVELASRRGLKVLGLKVRRAEAALGVNSRRELARAEVLLRERKLLSP